MAAALDNMTSMLPSGGTVRTKIGTVVGNLKRGTLRGGIQREGLQRGGGPEARPRGPPIEVGPPSKDRLMENQRGGLPMRGPRGGGGRGGTDRKSPPFSYCFPIHICPVLLAFSLKTSVS